MTRSYVPLLLLLSGIWGSSYMFIKVRLRDFSPAAMVEVRLLLATAVLSRSSWGAAVSGRFGPRCVRAPSSA